MYLNSNEREIHIPFSKIRRQMKAKDKVEIRFVGTPRCGINAIARWMSQHFDGYAFHQTHPLKKINKNKQFYSAYLEGIMNQQKNLINRSSKNGISVSFSWMNLNADLCFSAPRVYAGVNVLVLRDPYNQFASLSQSKTKWEKTPLNALDYITTRNVWKSHAETYLKDPKVWNGKELKILYNNWVIDKNYRKKILKVLNNINPLFSLKEFELQQKYTSSPFANKKVLQRFEEVKDCDALKTLKQYDSKVRRLTRNIFGIKI